MSVEYSFFDFAAPPMTGCGDFLESCRMAGLGDADLEEALRFFPKRNDGSRLRVSLVRHPCRWLAEVYGALSKPTPSSDVETHLVATAMLGTDKSNFDSFVRSHLRVRPRGVSGLFDQYKADSRMRLEDMPWALLELFETFDVPSVFCKFVEGYWRTRHIENPVEWKPHLYQQVLDAEEEFCCEHDYY